MDTVLTCVLLPRARLDEIIVFRQLTKGEVKEIADIMLREVFHRAEIKGITIDVTERFKVQHAPAARHIRLGQDVEIACGFASSTVA